MGGRFRVLAGQGASHSLLLPIGLGPWAKGDPGPLGNLATKGNHGWIRVTPWRPRGMRMGDSVEPGSCEPAASLRESCLILTTVLRKASSPLRELKLREERLLAQGHPTSEGRNRAKFKTQPVSSFASSLPLPTTPKDQSTQSSLAMCGSRGSWPSWFSSAA